MTHGQWLLAIIVVSLVAPDVSRSEEAGTTLAAPAVQGGPVVIDFESGPPLDTTPVTDEYVASSFVHFVQADEGFRPYRRAVTAERANSGTHVVDVGLDVCTKEVADVQHCETTGAGTQGRLTRTATSVTVFVGLLRLTSDREVTARLVALRADGTEAGSSPAVPVDATGFKVPVTVTSNAADIAAFALHAEGPGSTGGSALGFDDLTLTFPDTSAADVSLSLAGGNALVLLQGVTRDVPVSVERINGSNGSLALSLSALPPGITATLTPNPVLGTETNATLQLTATATAVSSSIVQFTVTADPQGNSAVAPAPRAAAGQVRVSANFELAAGGPGPALLGHCAAIEYPLRVQRSEAFNAVITLTAENVPAGVTATLLPDTLGPEGSILYLPILRLNRETRGIPTGSTIVVRATSPGVPDRTLTVAIGGEAPTATVNGPSDDGVLFGNTPMRERPGTEFTLVGNGFCPGTRVEVGNVDAVVDTVIADDGLSLKFNVPRLATTGPVTVLPPGAAGYLSDDEVEVQSFRSYYGFQFENFGWGSLSFAELGELVGDDELFARVNPCWPVYDCSVRTALPDPLAYASFLLLKGLAVASKEHCFGIVRTQQELLGEHLSYDRFLQGADHPYLLGSATGPGGELRSYLDGRHVAQFTEEFAHRFLFRSHEVDDQLELIRSELRAGRYPGVAIFPGGENKLKGHVVTAYDVEETAPGEFLIYVYDNETPFNASVESGSPNASAEHEVREIGDKGVIHVTNGRWSFKSWTGTGGTIWAFTFSDVPADPTLLGTASLLTLTFSMGQFASVDGAAQVSSIPDGAEWLPMLDENAVPMVAGTLLARGSQALTHTITGNTDGTYSELLAGEDFTGALIDVPTGTDVADQITVAPNDRTLEFTGTLTRPVQLTVSLALPDGGTHAALVRTTTPEDGRDSYGSAPTVLSATSTTARLPSFPLSYLAAHLTRALPGSSQPPCESPTVTV